MAKKHHQCPVRRPRRNGAAMIYFVVAIVPFMGLVSLAVDWGRVQLTKTELERVSFAGARAALQGLTTSVSYAQTSAAWVVGQNPVDGGTLTFDVNQDVEFGNWNTGTKTFAALSGTARSGATAIRVTARRTAARGNALPLMFGKIVGKGTFDVQAKAVVTVTTALYGVVGLDSITMTGNSSSSYWSSSGSSTKGNWGNIASNGNITLNGSSLIQGNAFHGAGYTVNDPSKVTGTVNTLAAPLSFPNGDASPYDGNNNSNGNAHPSNLPGNGFRVKSNETVTLPGGNYYFNNVDISGSLTFTGPATIYCFGSFSMAGHAYTNSNKPRNLKIVMIPDPVSGGPPGAVNIGSSSALYASIYAPQSAVTLSGTGDIYGAVLGKSINMTGSSGIHYDLTLDPKGGEITMVQ